jgi:ABC-type sugar transport system ATPase subunit
LRVEIKLLHRNLQNTMIYVTHDQIEAMTLADRIAVMKGGVIQQLDAPQTIYNRPVNRFVAGFLGSPAMNFLNGVVELLAGQAMAVRLAGGALVPIEARDGLVPGSPVSLGVRAEHMALAPSEPGGGVAGIPVTVQAAELLGDASYIYLTPDDGATQLIARVDAEARWQGGQGAVIRVEPARWHVFDADGQAVY